MRWTKNGVTYALVSLSNLNDDGDIVADIRCTEESEEGDSVVVGEYTFRLTDLSFEEVDTGTVLPSHKATILSKKKQLQKVADRLFK